MAVTVAALAVAWVAQVLGGFECAVLGLLVRVHRPWLSLVVAALAFGLAVRVGGAARLTAQLQGLSARSDRLAPRLAAAAAAVTLVVGLAWGTWSAGGADSSGYVSQALLWAQGRLSVDQPLAATAPWPLPTETFSPLGYRPAVNQPHAIVPTYPPGLPLSMAALALVFGPSAVFWVVPIAGAAAVWLTYRLGRAFAGPTVGAMAAVLLAASPVFLFQLVQPMSDVPVTAWWMAAAVCLAAGSPGLAGTFVAAALLTRPNLAPLTAWFVIGAAVRAYRVHGSLRAVLTDALLLALPAAAGLGFVLWLNNVWYGSPFLSGYGSAAGLYSWEPVGTNFRHYTTWLLQSQTPLVLLSLAAPFLVRPSRSAGASPRPRWVPAVFALGIPVVLLACYLPYFVFEEWWYLRFLLPGIPVILILTAAAARALAARLPVQMRTATLALGLMLLVSYYVSLARAGSAFALHDLEERYVTAGTWAAEHLPAGAVLISIQESGSLRLYSGRTTLRFDWLDPAWLDRAVAHLDRLGRPVYIAVEAWEEKQYRERFAETSFYGKLDWPPRAEIGKAVKVRFYDPRDRQRFLDGETIRTVKSPGASGRAGS
jgi:hypothetical protein